MKLREVLGTFKDLKTMSQTGFDDIVEDNSDNLDSLPIKIGSDWLIDVIDETLDKVDGTDVSQQIDAEFSRFLARFVSCVFDKSTGKIYTEFAVSYHVDDPDEEDGLRMVDNEPVVS